MGLVAFSSDDEDLFVWLSDDGWILGF